MSISRSYWLALLLLAVPAALDAQDRERNPDYFEKRIRPLLAERCYECHGVAKQKGGLRLDTIDGIRKGGDTGSLFDFVRPARSLLLTVVGWGDSDIQMPPKNKLEDFEIGYITKWVESGAPLPASTAQDTRVGKANVPTDFWSLKPLLRPAIPSVMGSDHKEAIDRFILSGLKEKGLEPLPAADRMTLLRRACFDLHGLPPSVGELEAFAGDERPDAWERVVDRLLASPRFGERWGRHWLDVARFGESVTLRGLVFQEAWRYRDFVIAAFNEDLSFQDFVRMQLAGDLLPAGGLADRQRNLIATTFLALGNTNLEEQDKAQLRMDVVDEQLDTIGRAFLGQTIGCARCHDHKFDPISTQDYYAMAGILRSTLTITNANVSGWIQHYLPMDRDAEARVVEFEGHLAALQHAIRTNKEARVLATGGGRADLAVISPSSLPGLVVDSSVTKTVGTWKTSQYSKHYIGDGYLHDDAAGKGEKTVTFIPELREAGRYEVRFAYDPGSSRATNVPLTIFHADGETRVLVNERQNPPIDRRFVSLGQFRFEGNGFGHVLVSTEGTSGHVTADAVQFLAATGGENNPQEPARREDSTKLSELDARIARLERELKALQETAPRRPAVMTVEEAPDIGDTRVHVRGNVHNTGAEVPRGFLQFASFSKGAKIPEKQSGRRELAEWIVDAGNPLTARVMVNRVWHWLFGAGLVRTPDNFGMMGDQPSHPELLDYLAIEFMGHDWSVKWLVREVMRSAVYQRRSEDADTAGQVDPENRWLARANRRRVDAESLRDSILSVAGTIDWRMGGTLLRPTLSADYGFQATVLRRSVYLPVLRNSLPEMFECFDFPDPSSVTGARQSSIVAPQALFLMNHPFVRENSKQAALRVRKLTGMTNRERLEWLFLTGLGRAPSPGERKTLLETVEDGDVEKWSAAIHAIFASADFRYIN